MLAGFAPNGAGVGEGMLGDGLWMGVGLGKGAGVGADVGTGVGDGVSCAMPVCMVNKKAQITDAVILCNRKRDTPSFNITGNPNSAILQEMEPLQKVTAVAKIQALVSALAFVTACSRQPPALTKIVLSVGQCGGPPCQAYQIGIDKHHTYLYTVYPHARQWQGKFNDFERVANALSQTGFFSRRYSDHNDGVSHSDVMTLWVESKSTHWQLYLTPTDPEYDKYKAFAGSMLRPVLRDVALTRKREARQFRDPRNLVGASVAHWLPYSCAAYSAHFDRTSRTRVAFFDLGTSPPTQKSTAIFVPFARIREQVAKNDLAALDEDYPSPSAEGPDPLNVTLLYKNSRFKITGNDPRYWPSQLSDFLTAVDKLVRPSFERLRTTKPGARCRSLRV